MLKTKMNIQWMQNIPINWMCTQSPSTLMAVNNLGKWSVYLLLNHVFVFHKWMCKRESSYERKEVLVNHYSIYSLDFPFLSTFGHIFVPEAIYKGIQHGSENGVEGWHHPVLGWGMLRSGPHIHERSCSIIYPHNNKVWSTGGESLVPTLPRTHATHTL